MRILNISAQKPDGTGSGTFLSQTVAAQVRAGHETAVICGVDAGDETSALPAATRVYDVRFNTPELPFHVCGMSDEMPYAATRYRDLTPAMEAAFERAFVGRLAQALDEFAPDVVICHHLYLLASIVREKVSGVPVVAVCHATDLRQMAMHGLEHDRIVGAMRRMDALFALHHAQVGQIVATYGVDPARVHVTGTGYDQHVFNETGPAPERIPGSIAFVGKVSFKKGVESLLAALDLIAPADVACPLSLTLRPLPTTRGSPHGSRSAAGPFAWPAACPSRSSCARIAQATSSASRASTRGCRSWASRRSRAAPSPSCATCPAFARAWSRCCRETPCAGLSRRRCLPLTRPTPRRCPPSSGDLPTRSLRP